MIPTPAVSIEEFDALRNDVASADFDQVPDTFREDYEFHGEPGVIRASYRGECKTCGLTVTLTASKQFWPEATWVSLSVAIRERAARLGLSFYVWKNSMRSTSDSSMADQSGSTSPS